MTFLLKTIPYSRKEIKRVEAMEKEKDEKDREKLKKMF